MQPRLPGSQSEWAIETRGLRKVYGDRVALEDLSITVGHGEVFGFLGPNGAGKTTAVKILVGLIRPTAGTGWVLGRPLGDYRARRQIGYLPELFRFHDWLTGEELLDLHGQLYGLSRAERRRRIPEVLELVGLTEAARRRVRTYSYPRLWRHSRAPLARRPVRAPGERRAFGVTMKALVIARLTFREGLRKKLVLGVVLLSLVFIVLYVWGFSLFVQDWRAMEARRAAAGAGMTLPYEVFASAMVLLGLWTVNFLAGVMTIFASVGTIASEIEQGTLHAIVPKPIRRWEIVLGKWLGYALMLVVYIAVMVATVVLTARFVGDYRPPNVLAAYGLIVLVALILLSLTILGSTLFSTVANGVIVFMLYGMAITGGLVEQIGTALDNDVLIRIGVISSILVPSDSMWRLASYLVQPRLAVNFLGPNPFGTTVPPSTFAVWYSVAYALVLLLLAMLRFQRRDL
jgi:Cu-processing system permease protein